MSGKLDVSRIKGASSAKVVMPDKQITLTIELPSGKKETMQVSPHSTAHVPLPHPATAVLHLL